MTATMPMRTDSVFVASHNFYVEERFNLDTEFCKELKERPVKWGFGLFSEVVYYRTYSRLMENDIQERWADTVIRVVEGVCSIRKDWLKKHGNRMNEAFLQTIGKDLANAIFDFKMLPPGRGLWCMGTDYIYKRGSMALNNCGFVDVKEDLADAAYWAMDGLMCGVGVGFSTQNADFGPSRIPGSFGEETYIIPDSREGWAESVRLLINSYFGLNDHIGDKVINFDYSHIRPAGQLLLGFGGIASGPDPLIKLHQRLREYLTLYHRRVDPESPYNITPSRLIADVMNAIGACVVAGNIRRSAELATGSVSDTTFLNLKNYDLYPERSEIGWMSNNSVVLGESAEFELLPAISERICDNGEPGIINLINIKKYSRVGKKKTDHAVGMNPCFTADTKIWTLFGPMRFDQLVGQEIPVLTQRKDGKLVFRRMYDIRVTGQQRPIYRVATKAKKGRGKGTIVEGEFRATGNHVVFLSDGSEIQVKDLQPGDHVSSVYRRVANQKGYLRLTNTAGDSDMEHRIIAAWQTDERPAYPEFHVDHKDEDKQNNHPENLRILPHAEHNAINMLGNKNPVNRFPERNFNKWQPGHTPTLGFSGRKHTEETKASMRAAHSKNRAVNHIIVSVEEAGFADVYDGTVDDTHCFFVMTEEDGAVLAHNCAEIPLEDRELCNLAEIFPVRCESASEVWDMMRLATFYASTVSLLPSHSYTTNVVVTRNRRIGVSVSGIADWIDASSLSHVTMVLREGYERIVDPYNIELAKEAGVPPSIRLTTVKPSGTISLLAGVSPGMNWPVGSYVIRRFRISENYPMVEKLMAAGIPHEADAYSDNTLCFSFPLASGRGRTRSVKDVSVWEQASLAAMLQREWADNAVSNTLTFQHSEHKQIERVIAAFAPLIKSISLLPDQEDAERPYAQPPYERITKDRYNELRADIDGEINWNDFSGADGAESQFCDTDVCEIPA